MIKLILRALGILLTFLSLMFATSESFMAWIATETMLVAFLGIPLALIVWQYFSRKQLLDNEAVFKKYLEPVFNSMASTTVAAFVAGFFTVIVSAAYLGATGAALAGYGVLFAGLFSLVLSFDPWWMVMGPRHEKMVKWSKERHGIYD